MQTQDSIEQVGWIMNIMGFCEVKWIKLIKWMVMIKRSIINTQNMYGKMTQYRGV